METKVESVWDQEIKRGVKQSWDLGSFAAVLQCLHLDKPLLEQQNTNKLYGIKNNYVKKIKKKKECLISSTALFTNITVFTLSYA